MKLRILAALCSLPLACSVDEPDSKANYSIDNKNPHAKFEFAIVPITEDELSSKKKKKRLACVYKFPANQLTGEWSNLGLKEIGNFVSVETVSKYPLNPEDTMDFLSKITWLDEKKILGNMEEDEASTEEVAGALVGAGALATLGAAGALSELDSISDIDTPDMDFAPKASSVNFDTPGGSDSYFMKWMMADLFTDVTSDIFLDRYYYNRNYSDSTQYNKVVGKTLNNEAFKNAYEEHYLKNAKVQIKQVDKKKIANLSNDQVNKLTLGLKEEKSRLEILKNKVLALGENATNEDLDRVGTYLNNLAEDAKIKMPEKAPVDPFRKKLTDLGMGANAIDAPKARILALNADYLILEAALKQKHQSVTDALQGLKKWSTLRFIKNHKVLIAGTVIGLAVTGTSILVYKSIKDKQKRKFKDKFEGGTSMSDFKLELFEKGIQKFTPIHHSDSCQQILANSKF